MFKIGNVIIKNPIILAPMAGISNTSYRKIIKEMNPGLIYCEMVSDKAIVFGSKKTLDLLKYSDYERPIAQQIFGSDKNSFVQAAKKIYELQKPDIIDINMGCPVPKVALKAQAGASLLKNPDKIKEIVQAVVQAVPCPVTVKIRSGWDENSINAKEVAMVCEEAGAKAIAIHARTRAQGYSGQANWSIIKEVVQSVSIPVIGNGDVTSPLLAKKMLDETGCAGVMIGRAAIGNPWLIKECVNYVENNKLDLEPTIEEKIQMIERHYNLLREDVGENLANLQIRNFIMYYLKGIPGAKRIKVLICNAQNQEEIISILKNFENELSNN